METKQYLVFDEKRQTGVLIHAANLTDLQATMAEKRLFEFDVYECTAKFREKREVVNVLEKEVAL